MSIKEVAVLVKRLPATQTQANFLDWNRAFQLFAVSLGLGAIIWPGVCMFADPDESASSSSSSKPQTRAKAVADDAEEKNDDHAPVTRKIVSRQPTSDDEAQALCYAYTVLMSTVSPSLQYLVRCVPYGSLKAAYQAVQYFIINDNTSRWRMRATFSNLEMQPDEEQK
mmetsp:Transcript_41657/g.81734  ORF Transcript_41657/g.81734 Transcript_41657/m.81734 type:complete len:168 (+) Transcript_41657:362-865(+)